MDNYFNNASLIQLMYKWKYHLVIITLVAAILGAIFSGSTFITPLYKSEAVAYPANVSPYSDESETEQMLQIINSQSIMDSIVEKFDLMKHYKIDKEYKYWKTALIGEYREKVKISKTPYEAVSITVLDKDPEIASEMVKEILNQYDQKVRYLHQSKRFEVVKMYEKQLDSKRHLIDSIQQRIEELAINYGMVDYGAQSVEVMRGYLKTFDGNNNAVNSKAVNTLKENLEKYGGEMLLLVQHLQNEARTYADAKVFYEQEMRFLNSTMTYSNVVSEPFPADKKCYPIRWVVVALSGLGAFIISLLVIFALENKKMFFQKEKQ